MWEDKTILIVEDDDISTELFGEILEETNVTALYATDANTAIDICKNKHVDIVLMDIQLHGMSGCSALLEIKKLNQEIVVIAQTAFAMSGDREKYISLGFDNYIAKPIYPKDLLKLLSKYMDIH
jgi:two-component system sensor histidine kinase/response regulator